MQWLCREGRCNDAARSRRWSDALQLLLWGGGYVPKRTITSIGALPCPARHYQDLRGVCKTLPWRAMP